MALRNGIGVARGTAFDKAVAELATGRSSPTIDVLRRCAPPVRAYPRAVTELGVRVVTGYRFRKADLEIWDQRDGAPAMADLKGIDLAMQTPFDAEGRVSVKVREELIDAYVDAGVHGLVFGSGTGQHPYLTEDECNRLYQVGARPVNGRCNVIGQFSALNMDEVIHRSRQAEAVGGGGRCLVGGPRHACREVGRRRGRPIRAERGTDAGREARRCLASPASRALGT